MCVEMQHILIEGEESANAEHNDDGEAVCYDVLRHRIGLTYEAEAENISTEQIISKILDVVEVP